MTAPSPRPSRPRLLPALVVARRDQDTLQVGIDPPHRVLLPDHPGVRRLLDALARGESPPLDCEQATQALARLVIAGLVIADQAPAPTATIRIEASGDSLTEVRLALTEAGCLAGGPRDITPDLAIIAGLREPRRALSDELVREGLPHLFVAGIADGYRVGPFVVPGSTACLRCIDAWHAEADPRRGLIVEQASRPEDPPVDDPLVHRMAISWAARDVRRYLGGLEPSTWSATVQLGAGSMPTRQAWRRHPHCGCAWDQLAAG